MNLMVCYDGSKAAKAALEVAKSRAKNFGAKIFVVTAMVSGPQVPRDDFVKREKELEKVKRQLSKADIACETTLSVKGLEPGEDLVIFARENDTTYFYFKSEYYYISRDIIIQYECQ